MRRSTIEFTIEWDEDSHPISDSDQLFLCRFPYLKIEPVQLYEYVYLDQTIIMGKMHRICTKYYLSIVPVLSRESRDLAQYAESCEKDFFH